MRKAISLVFDGKIVQVNYRNISNLVEVIELLDLAADAFANHCQMETSTVCECPVNIDSLLDKMIAHNPQKYKNCDL